MSTFVASLTFTPAFSVSSLTSHATDRESTKAAVHSHLGLQGLANFHSFTLKGSVHSIMSFYRSYSREDQDISVSKTIRTVYSSNDR